MYSIIMYSYRAPKILGQSKKNTDLQIRRQGVLYKAENWHALSHMSNTFRNTIF